MIVHVDPKAGRIRQAVGRTWSIQDSRWKLERQAAHEAWRHANPPRRPPRRRRQATAKRNEQRRVVQGQAGLVSGSPNRVSRSA